MNAKGEMSPLIFYISTSLHPRKHAELLYALVAVASNRLKRTIATRLIANDFVTTFRDPALAAVTTGTTLAIRAQWHSNQLVIMEGANLVAERSMFDRENWYVVVIIGVCSCL